jgi:hypothetical protein
MAAHSHRYSFDFICKLLNFLSIGESSFSDGTHLADGTCRFFTFTQIDVQLVCGKNDVAFQYFTGGYLMKSIALLGVLTFAFTFCGLTERLKSVQGGANSTSNSSATSSTSGDAPSGEKASLNSAQQAAIAGGDTVEWDKQGIEWTVPKGWKKTDVSQLQFNYASPDNAFLLVSISELPDSFPMESSLKSEFDAAMQQLRNKHYESVRMLNIDGIDGVEFVEAPPEEKDGIRRHQWIGYRTYLGQKQQINVMTSTSQTKFDKHKDEFSAIMYSMRSTS